nr:hypothetical protein Iba_chr11dCG13490 [Ipomoea batatas]
MRKGVWCFSQQLTNHASLRRTYELPSLTEPANFWAFQAKEKGGLVFQSRANQSRFLAKSVDNWLFQALEEKDVVGLIAKEKGDLVFQSGADHSRFLAKSVDNKPLQGRWRSVRLCVNAHFFPEGLKGRRSTTREVLINHPLEFNNESHVVKIRQFIHFSGGRRFKLFIIVRNVQGVDGKVTRQTTALKDLPCLQLLQSSPLGQTPRRPPTRALATLLEVRFWAHDQNNRKLGKFFQGR